MRPVHRAVYAAQAAPITHREEPENPVSDTSVAEGAEGQSSEVEAAAAVETPATDFEAQATEYKNRFAGSQKRLTEEMNARKAAEEEREQLRQWKAEKERADMTEVERLKAEIEDAKNDLVQARSEAQRERLARKFPLAVEFYGDDALPSEERLAALQERLAGGDEESEQEPVIDPNRPGKQPAPKPDPMAAADRWLRSTLDGI